MNLESLEGILDDCLACGKKYPGLANYNNGLTTKNTYISADPGRQGERATEQESPIPTTMQQQQSQQ